MYKWIKTIIIWLSFAAIFYFLGKSFYNYFFDTSIPTIFVKGLENNKTYSGTVDFFIDVADEYKVKHISATMDSTPIVNKYSINSSSYSLPLSLSTLPLQDGQHSFTVDIVDSAYRSNSATKTILFFIDNMPLECMLINQNPIKVFQGNTLHIQIQSNKVNIHGVAKTNNITVPCISEGRNSKIYECFIPIATETEPHDYIVTFEIEDDAGNKALLETLYTVLPQQFKKQTIGLNNKKMDEEIALSFPQSKLKEIVNDALPQSPARKLWKGNFCTPCMSKGVTTPFGVIRTSVERGRYRHDAVDFLASPKGPVWASQDGIVIVKDRFLYSGNTVVIDHGCGIMSLYGHLNSMPDSIVVGSSVKKGDIIGTIGMTGYATGYHLHWELKINGINVNPLEWIKDDVS